ncbi:type IV secretion system DNA-binding domain-containing protein [Sphingobium yanoikuyae]
MPRINIRLKDALYEPLAARAKSARNSLPEYVCEILHRFGRNDARGYHDRSDEVQATLVQVFAILTGSIRTEGSDILQKGMDDARPLCHERVLRAPDDGALMSIFCNQTPGSWVRGISGLVEQIKPNDGLTHGFNGMRDGGHLSRVQITRPLVMPTQVMHLPNLTGYLAFGRDLPVMRFTDRNLKVERVATASAERRTPAVKFDDTQKDEPESGIGNVDRSNAVEAGDPLDAVEDMLTLSSRAPDGDRDNRSRAPLPLIGISINSFSRPGELSRPADPA